MSAVQVINGGKIIYSGDDLEKGQRIAYSVPIERMPGLLLGVLLRFNGKTIFTRS